MACQTNAQIPSMDVSAKIIAYGNCAHNDYNAILTQLDGWADAADKTAVNV